MDWINSIIGFVVAMGGTFLYYRETKKSKLLENEAKQSDEWKKLYYDLKEEVREKETKIETLYDEIREIRNEHFITQRDHESARVMLVSHQLLRCEKPGCAQRDPPSGY